MKEINEEGVVVAPDAMDSNGLSVVNAGVLEFDSTKMG